MTSSRIFGNGLGRKSELLCFFSDLAELGTGGEWGSFRMLI